MSKGDANAADAVAIENGLGGKTGLDARRAVGIPFNGEISGGNYSQSRLAGE
jgi:hypothetical protein